MIWSIIKRMSGLGSPHLKEAASASQCVTALAGVCRTRKHQLCKDIFVGGTAPSFRFEPVITPGWSINRQLAGNGLRGDRCASGIQQYHTSPKKTDRKS